MTHITPVPHAESLWLGSCNGSWDPSLTTQTVICFPAADWPHSGWGGDEDTPSAGTQPLWKPDDADGWPASISNASAPGVKLSPHAGFLVCRIRRGAEEGAWWTKTCWSLLGSWGEILLKNVHKNKNVAFHVCCVLDLSGVDVYLGGWGGVCLLAVFPCPCNPTFHWYWLRSLAIAESQRILFCLLCFLTEGTWSVIHYEHQSYLWAHPTPCLEVFNFCETFFFFLLLPFLFQC